MGFGFGNLVNRFNQVRSGLGNARTFLHSAKNKFGFGINNIQSNKLDEDNFRQEFAEMKRKLLNDDEYKGYDIDCLLKNGAVNIYEKDPDRSMFNASGHAEWTPVYRLKDLYPDPNNKHADPNWKYDNIEKYPESKSAFNDLIRQKLHIFSKRPIIKMVVDKTKFNLCARAPSTGQGAPSTRKGAPPTRKGGSSNATYRRRRSSSRKNYKRTTSVNRVRSVNHTRKYRNRK